MVHVAPKTLKEVFDSIIYIGRTTNTIKKAKKVVSSMKREFEQLRNLSLRGVKRRGSPKEIATPFDKLRVRDDKLKVYMEEWPIPPMASGNWVPELVEIAGGTPVIAKSGKPSAEFSITKLQKADPDVMIFHWCGYGERFNKELVTKRPGWDQLRAIKQNKLFVIDDSLLNRPGPRLVKGVKQIQQILRTQNSTI